NDAAQAAIHAPCAILHRIAAAGAPSPPVTVPSQAYKKYYF
ncbi:19415_t:CDS:1, partial [Racocetra fulgida]